MEEPIFYLDILNSNDLPRHFISMEEPKSYNNRWRHGLDRYACQWFPSTYTYTYTYTYTVTRIKMTLHDYFCRIKIGIKSTFLTTAIHTLHLYCTMCNTDFYEGNQLSRNY